MTIAIQSDLCDGCGICLRSCPVDVLRLDGSTQKAYVAYSKDCHVCGLCEDDCPQRAITIDYAINNPRQVSIYDTLDIPIPPIEGFDI